MSNTNTTTAPRNDLVQFAAACTYNAIKYLYRGKINTKQGGTIAIHAILSGQKPEYLEDARQEWLLSMLEAGINLNQPVHCIKAQAAAIIAHTTKEGKEINALQRAAYSVRAFVRRTSNGTYTTTRRINGKATTMPCLAIDHYTPGTEYRDRLYYIADMQSEDSIKAAHIATIHKAAKNPDKAQKMIDIYNALQAGYTQQEISTALDLPTSTTSRYVQTIRAALATDYTTLDALGNKHQ